MASHPPQNILAGRVAHGRPAKVDIVVPAPLIKQGDVILSESESSPPRTSLLTAAAHFGMVAGFLAYRSTPPYGVLEE
jgi:hypothetical protein